MGQTPYEQAKALFIAAHAMGEGEREGYIDAQADSPEVASRVRDLLRAAGASVRAMPSIAPGLEQAAAAIIEHKNAPDHEHRHDALIGKVIAGEFEIRRFITAGGMGQVYEAKQAKPRRLVAIKVLKAEYTGGAARSRFKHEADHLAKLNHPGIAQVYKYGEFDEPGRPFLAMEYVENALSITEFANKGGLSVPERVDLFSKVVEAVAHGHSNGIIHRDIKPSNILVGVSGQPKVIDFGIARATNADLTIATMHTEQGQVLGTLNYMSPEQARGDAGAVDVRSDLYALGVVLYELLTGRMPYSFSENMSILEAAAVINQMAPLPFAAARGEIGKRKRRRGRGNREADSEAIVMKLLEKDRAERYASALDLLADLRRWMVGEPISIRSPGPISRLFSWMDKNRVKAASAVWLLIIGLAALIAYVSVYVTMIRPDRVTFDHTKGVAILESRDGRHLHTWELSPAAQVVDHVIVERPRELGGGRLAIIVGTSAAPSDAAAFDLGDTERGALWTTHTSSLKLPEGALNHAETPLHVSDIRAFDAFPSLPGLEVMIEFRHGNFSTCCVQIVDQTGKVRYQVWHDGAVASAIWLAEPSVLVLAAHNSEASWQSRGVAGLLIRYPSVLVGLRPVDGHINESGLLVEVGQRLDSTLAWYKWVGPMPGIEFFGEMQPEIRRWTGHPARMDAFTVYLSSLEVGDSRRPIPGVLVISIDAEGREISRYSDEVYKDQVRRGVYKDDSIFQFFDYESLPPIRGKDAAVGH